MKSPYFGDILGANRGVVAYANKGWSKEKIGFQQVYGIETGIKYQCVEYARRWLVIVKGLKFEDVGIATHIWELKVLHDIITNQEIPLTQVPNGSGTRPKVGDILIYNNGGRLPFGHVAIIVWINPSNLSLRIAEQNEFDHFWHGDYSRELSLNPSKHFKISDKYPILGWQSYADR
jgi:hypothetical protein